MRKLFGLFSMAVLIVDRGASVHGSGGGVPGATTMPRPSVAGANMVMNQGYWRGVTHKPDAPDPAWFGVPPQESDQYRGPSNYRILGIEEIWELLSCQGVPWVGKQFTVALGSGRVERGVDGGK